ncbi:hypothetical protein HMPREF1508_1968 [Shuttleworthella sp. MSX8B]|nr:hypothetical protein HMPREF1508_1968 [Shuttleworthia sp. MSX8B]
MFSFVFAICASFLLCDETTLLYQYFLPVLLFQYFSFSTSLSVLLFQYFSFSISLSSLFYRCFS